MALISKALIDFDISHEEFKKLLMKRKNMNKLKKILKTQRVLMK